jgi:hypothetical protein
MRVKRILKIKNMEVSGGLGQRVVQARNESAQAQAAFLFSRGNADCQRKERESLHHYVSISAAKENFLKQKARSKWLNLGDGNTAFFSQFY